MQGVTTLTLERGKYTTGRRSASVPQLFCIGGTAQGKFAPNVVQCYNRGFDGRDVQWECKATMSSDYQFGKVSVLFIDFFNFIYRFWCLAKATNIPTIRTFWPVRVA